MSSSIVKAQRNAGIGIAAIYIVGIIAANYVTTRYGFVPVGFGVTATAGTFFAGLALALRDVGQDVLGRRNVSLLILAGCVVSYGVSDAAIASASAVAFLTSEFLDMAVYSPIRRRATFGNQKWAAAMLLSGAVGSVIDTVVFLGLAFGAASLTALAIIGQLIGKAWVVLAVTGLGWAMRGRLAPIASRA